MLNQKRKDVEKVLKIAHQHNLLTLYNVTFNPV